ncbi:MAG: hypothetical protein U9N85_08060 [Bacteroidota bacterium]|nr:hypothetical protein [Bacteroidota bacterium]
MNTAIKILTIILISLIVTSCGVPKKPGNLKKEAAQTGIQIMENTHRLYENYRETVHNFNYKSEQMNIMVGNSGFTQKSFAQEQKRIQETQEYVSAYKQLFQSYLKTIEAKDEDENKTKEFTANALNCLELTKTYNPKNISELTEEQINAYQMNPQEVMQKLIALMSSVIPENIDRRNDYLKGFYKKYSAGLKQIPVQQFDSVKIVQQIDEPYSDKKVLVNLYKLKVDKELYDFINVKTEHAEKTKTLINGINHIYSNLNKKGISKKELAKQISSIKKEATNKHK